jgi:hypothetical protein
MPTHSLEDDLYRAYDQVVSLTLLNIWKITHEREVIRLYHFDRKNKEHMYILHIALLARDLFGFPIEVEGSRWDIFCLNRKLRKGFEKVKRYKHVTGEGAEWLYAKGGVCVPELIDFMRPEAEEQCGCYFPFRAIYEAYYEGSK